MLAPLRKLGATARSIGSTDDLTRRIEVTGDDEIAELGHLFNAMLDRLEQAFALQREFVSDAGHELRTPITIIRGHLQLLDDATRRRCRIVADELDRMNRFVEDLLTLAKAERPDFLLRSELDLDLLTDELMAKARKLAPRDWQLEHTGAGLLTADRQRLTQAVMNLAHNAVKHTAEGDTITLGSALDDGDARIWVADSGAGIASAGSGADLRALRARRRRRRGPRPGDRRDDRRPPTAAASSSRASRARARASRSCCPPHEQPDPDRRGRAQPRLVPGEGAARRGLRDDHGQRRPVGDRARPRRGLRAADPRPRAADPRRHRGAADAPRAGAEAAGDHPVRARRRARQGRRPAARSRRLPDQAVRARRAARADPGPPPRAPGRASRWRSPSAASSLDLRTRRATVEGREIELSAREFALLELFLRHPDQVLSREQLLARVWGYDFDPGSNVVEVYVGYLRRKLGPDHITTVRGMGYRLLSRRPG